MQKLKAKKLEAAGLMLVIGIITTLSLVIMANYKLITNTHKTFSIRGINDNETIANNSEHGTFICYKGANGKLNSLYYIENPSGNTKKEEKYNLNSNCEFIPNNPTLKYRFTLVGGGGGGTKTQVAKSKALYIANERDEKNNIISTTKSEVYGDTTIYLPSKTNPKTKYGHEETTRQFFCTQDDMITEDENGKKIDTCWENYKKEVSEFIKKFPLSLVYEKKGVYNYKCEAKFNNNFDVTTLFNDTDNNVSDVSVGDFGTYSAYSFGYIDKDTQAEKEDDDTPYRENLEIYSNDASGDKCRRYSNNETIFKGLLNADYGIQVSELIPEEDCNISPLCTGSSDNFYTLPRMVHHSFSRNQIEIIESTPGSKGEISSREIAGIPERIIIKPENIGNGGIGETNAAPAENGGITRLQINNITITANGGNAGIITNKTRVFKYANNGSFDYGAITDSNGNAIPSEEEYKLKTIGSGESVGLIFNKYVNDQIYSENFKKMKASYPESTIDGNTKVDIDNMRVFGNASKITQDGSNFKMVIPEFPGTSGAAGIIILNDYKPFLRPYLVADGIPIPDNRKHDKFKIPQSAGGTGASGAIIIEW